MLRRSRTSARTKRRGPGRGKHLRAWPGQDEPAPSAHDGSPNLTSVRRPAVPIALLSSASVGSVLVVGLLGTSVGVPPLPAGPGPPWTLRLHPSPWLVMALLLVAVIAGALAVGLGLRSLRRGWRPRAMRLAVAGLVAAGTLLLVPPVGSADVYSYAAYGQMKAAGLDPYVTAPSRAAELGVPAANWVQPPWQHTPSVYGPAATRLQTWVARLTRSSARGTVVALAGLNALAFALTGLLLFVVAGGEDARRRVGVLWWTNPLLLYELVAGAHLDTIAVCLAVAGLAVLRRSRLLGGALAGLAVAVKAPMALVAGAMAWADRRSLRRLAMLAAGGAAVAGTLYLTAGPHVLDQARRVSRFVSPATPWRPLTNALDATVGWGTSRVVVAASALALAVVVGVALNRMAPAVAPRSEAEAVRSGLVWSMAWVLTAPYVLPWYDAPSWALLALAGGGAVDTLLAVHTTALAIGFLPGRYVPMPPALDAVVFALHHVLCPAVLAGVVFVSLRQGLAMTRRHPDAIARGVPAGAGAGAGVEECGT